MWVILVFFFVNVAITIGHQTHNSKTYLKLFRRASFFINTDPYNFVCVSYCPWRDVITAGINLFKKKGCSAPILKNRQTYAAAAIVFVKL